MNRAHPQRPHLGAPDLAEFESETVDLFVQSALSLSQGIKRAVGMSRRVPPELEPFGNVIWMIRFQRKPDDANELSGRGVFVETPTPSEPGHDQRVFFGTGAGDQVSPIEER